MPRIKGSKNKTKEEVLKGLKKPKNLGGAPKLYTEEVINELADDLLAWLEESDDHIFIYDWCKKHRIDPDFPSKWRVESSRFNRAMRCIEKQQESRCFQGALYKQLDSRMATFALSCKHGWVDKSKVEISGDKENPLHFVLALAERSSADLVEEE